MFIRSKKGFTLIELLVVVLIIGILAAVALPQYRKAVQKSRMSQIDVLMNTADKSIASYLLSNGTPSETVMLSGEDSVGSIDASKNCVGNTCFTKAGGFSIACEAGGVCGLEIDTAHTSESTTTDNWLEGARITLMRDTNGKWYLESVE